MASPRLPFVYVCQSSTLWDGSLGLGNDQQVSTQNHGIAAGDDGVSAALDENDQGVAGQIQIPQRLTPPAVVSVDDYLLQGELFPVLKFPGRCHQQVPRQKQSVPLGNDVLSFPTTCWW